MFATSDAGWLDLGQKQATSHRASVVGTMPEQRDSRMARPKPPESRRFL